MANHPDATGTKPIQGNVRIAAGWDGSDYQALAVDSDGKLEIGSAPAPAGAATEAEQALATAARTFTKTSTTWTADDGTSDVELTLAAGTYWVHAVAHSNAQAATAATYTLHMSTNSGFTPDADIEEFYTSDADITLPSGVYDAFLAPVPITVPVAGKIYIRVVPDAGTTTGALDLYTTPNA